MNDELLNSLIQREDIIITLHIAFYTEAAVENLIVDALDAAMDVINTGDTSSESELVKMSFYKNNTNYDSTTYKDGTTMQITILGFNIFAKGELLEVISI